MASAALNTLPRNVCGLRHRCMKSPVVKSTVLTLGIASRTTTHLIPYDSNVLIFRSWTLSAAVDDRQGRLCGEPASMVGSCCSAGDPAPALHAEPSQFGCILFGLAQIRLTVLHLAVLVRPLERLVLEGFFGIFFSLNTFVLRNHP